MTAETFTLNIEFTDTFGGEANYSWVKRATLTVPCGLNNATLMRRAKAAMGLSGLRGRSFAHGDSWEFRPANSCTVMFANVQY